MDALAVRLTVPPAGSVGDFHLQVNTPCRAHQRGREAWNAGPPRTPLRAGVGIRPTMAEVFLQPFAGGAVGAKAFSQSRHAGDELANFLVDKREALAGVFAQVAQYFLEGGRLEPAWSAQDPPFTARAHCDWVEVQEWGRSCRRTPLRENSPCDQRFVLRGIGRSV